MEKKMKILSLLITTLLLATSELYASEIKFSQPQEPTPLMKNIDSRLSSRTYDTKNLSTEELGNILWVAFGTNSHGTRTIPTSQNQQDLKIFVLYNNAVWQYDGKNHRLNKYSDEDLLPSLALQDFVKQAPVHLIYAGGKDVAETHSGSAYQNVYLYAAENGLATIVRGYFNREEVHQKLKLSDDEIVTYHQVIGYPAK